ncbi:putative membrane protein [Synechococcus sp. BOUM118]|nr:putative membrane protein [Synechococcus sp. BOUM118]
MKLPYKLQVFVLSFAIICVFEMLMIQDYKFLSMPIDYSTPSYSILWTFIISLLPLTFLDVKESKHCKSISSWIFFVFFYFSICVVGRYYLADLPNYLTFTLSICSCLYLYNFTLKLRIPGIVFNLSKAYTASKRFFPLITLLIAIGYIYVIISFRPSFNLNDLYIYDLRSNARFLDQSFSAYAQSPFRIVIPSFLIFFGITYKKYYYFIVVAISSITLFFIDGTKSSLLIPFILCYFYFLCNKSKPHIWLLVSFFFLIIISLLFFSIPSLENNLVTTLISERLLIVPGGLSALTWSYLPDISDPARLSYEVGKYFYQIDTTQLVINANSNLFLTGFAYAGLFGGLIVALMAGTFTLIIFSTSRLISPVLSIYLTCVSMFTWAEQAFHTSLLSSALIFLIIYPIYFYSIKTKSL